MRKKVGQEATEEMSAFKGVVNLFIVVRLYLSQRITCFQNGVRGNEKWLQAVKSRLTAKQRTNSSGWGHTKSRHTRGEF